MPPLDASPILRDQFNMAQFYRNHLAHSDDLLHVLGHTPARSIANLVLACEHLRELFQVAPTQG